MTAPTYSQEQLALYFDRIHFYSVLPENPLTRLSELVRHQLIHVPFETLGLHYSKEKEISLEADDLFEKVVIHRRGGYCLENNTFFGHVLGSIGYERYNVVCRISRGTDDGSWRPMSHLAIIVTVDGIRYLIDVGYGIDGPIRPLPLSHGIICEGLPGQQLRLEHKVLPQHQDLNQRVWVYSQRRGPDGWQDVYHFAETEFIPQDYEILNYYTMKKSRWAQMVVAQRFVLDDESHNISKTILLSGDEVRVGDGQTKEAVVERLDGEEARVKALGKHFQITISKEQQLAIRGSIAELVKR